MQQIVAHSGRPAFVRPTVTLSHFFPPSLVTCSNPSSLPTQIRPAFFGDSATAKMVPYTSTPVLSPVIGPPDHFCFDLSLRVRTPLIAVQVLPPSLLLKSTLAVG